MRQCNYLFVALLTDRQLVIQGHHHFELPAGYSEDESGCKANEKPAFVGLKACCQTGIGDYLIKYFIGEQYPQKTENEKVKCGFECMAVVFFDPEHDI